MGRRSFGLSTTQINRWISASNAAEKARERERLIYSQIGISKEQKPQYSIESFDFNSESRVSHIVFLETTRYRKIEKYVTQEGQRYPIYSEWLTKTKKIKKTIKLTNEALESLNYHEDALIAGFSYDIVANIGNEDFYPSWFIIETLRYEEKDEINFAIQPYIDKIKQEKNIIAKQGIEAENEQSKKGEILSKLEKFEHRKGKLQNAISKAKNRKNILILSILTLGIYAIIHSHRRVERLEKNIKEIDGFISDCKSGISLCDNRIKKINNEIENSREIIKENEEQKTKVASNIKKEYEEKYLSIEPLPVALTDSGDSEFIPLKKLSGMNYEKIVGCYVIKNIEKNKYYVGQSKDVLKRVCKQHFNGTKIKNIAFAEDYYSSKLENKDDLFEVRIIRLNTKDELDKKEKELIEAYDAFNSGYNETNGNK